MTRADLVWSAAYVAAYNRLARLPAKLEPPEGDLAAWTPVPHTPETLAAACKAAADACAESARRVLP